MTLGSAVGGRWVVVVVVGSRVMNECGGCKERVEKRGPLIKEGGLIPTYLRNGMVIGGQQETITHIPLKGTQTETINDPHSVGTAYSLHNVLR